MVKGRARLPAEYRRAIPAGPLFSKVNHLLEQEKLNTICVSGKCPNRGECFSRGTLAFMILGDLCTRHCGFCAVKAGNPEGVVDTNEPERLARTAVALNLKHVVITAVARDDLKDGGAAIFADCIRALHTRLPSAIVEVLTSDFLGDEAAIQTVINAAPDIYNHNIETVERLTPKIRSKAQYQRSLALLAYVKRHARNPDMRREPVAFLKTKSGLMLGLGETRDEVLQALKDLRSVGCDYLTIGQYLQPSTKHLQIQHFVPVDDFHYWRDAAYNLGFERVASGPLVRSSYFADALHKPTKESI